MTLIGNRRGLAFELVPLSPPWESRYAPEQAAWAALSIWINNENLCRHLVPGSTEVNDRLYVPLGPIADWVVSGWAALAFEERAALFPTTRSLHEDLEQWGQRPAPLGLTEDAWLDEREAWWSRHFLSAAADGSQLPNLAFVRDDEELGMSWAPPRFAAVDAPQLLVPQGHHAVSWPEGRAVLRGFVEQVAAWFRSSGKADVFGWATESDPLQAEASGLPHAVELLTGRRLPGLEALYDVSGWDGVLDRLGLPEDADDPATSPQCQILRDLSPWLDGDLGSVISELAEQATQGEPDRLERWRRSRAIALDAARAASTIHGAGQAAAGEIRRALDLDGGPVDAIADSLRQLGLRYEHRDVSGGHDRMIVGGAEAGSFCSLTLRTVRTEHEWGQCFEAARALGHVLLDPMRGGSLGAASGPFAQASRRMRSGAFAAELLLPERAIRALSGEKLDGASHPRVFAQIMEQYGVGARTAAYQLWNCGWLSSPVIRDELIDQFSAVG